MKWEEVRKIYPNKFVKLQILEFHFEENIKIIDEMSLIKVIDDNNNAAREFFNCEASTIAYHTANEKISVEFVQQLYFNKYKFRRRGDYND